MTARHRHRRFQGGMAALVLLAACARELPGEEPPEQSFYYPMGLATSPDDAYVYVVSSNFDLQFNAGWVSSIDVDALIAAIDGGGDTRASIVDRLKVPPLGGALDLDATGTLGVLASRGGMPLTVLNVAGSDLSCGDPAAEEGLSTDLRKTDCDRSHLTQIDIDLVADDVLDGGPVARFEIQDPYAAQVFERADGSGELYAAVSYLSSGRLSLFELDRASSTLEHVRLMLPLAGAPMQALAVYPSSEQTLLVGANRASSITGSRLFDVDVARSLDERVDRYRSVRIFEDIGGAETSDIAFDPSGTRAFVTVRFPDAVAMLDARLAVFQEGGNPDGTYNDGIRRPSYETLAAVPVNGRPSALTWVGRAAGPLVAVAAFDDDALFVLEPTAADLSIVRRFDRIALGPVDMVSVQRGGRDLILVTTFFDHSVVVIDVTSDDPVDFGVVATVANEELQPDGPVNR